MSRRASRRVSNAGIICFEGQTERTAPIGQRLAKINGHLFASKIAKLPLTITKVTGGLTVFLDAACIAMPCYAKGTYWVFAHADADTAS